MTMPLPVLLKEQEIRIVALRPQDVAVLKDDLKFAVSPAQPADLAVHLATGEIHVAVNPKQYVGHVVLPSSQVVVISPKIPAANVFRMLAYVYLGRDSRLFDFKDVQYADDSLLFEPLVALFNRLVAEQVRRGLAQDYVVEEGNLTLLRGRIDFRQHLIDNHHRPDRLSCRFHERTINVQDNRIVKHTLVHVLSHRCWTQQTLQQLGRNLGVFADVDMLERTESAFAARAYGRFTDDYRVLHGLCRMLLDNRALNEGVGDKSFNGFLLDMNYLFERFISTVFTSAAQGTPYRVFQQEPGFLSERPNLVLRIEPDVVVRKHGQPVLIADAKYKRASSVYENHDCYQMLAYATALNCAETYLFYPLTEVVPSQAARIRNSPVCIEMQTVDLASTNCVAEAEAQVADLLSGLMDKAAVA
jgi:5-methylcytosine-specific restriction enzyme subunit McrC